MYGLQNRVNCRPTCINSIGELAVKGASRPTPKRGLTARSPVLQSRVGRPARALEVSCTRNSVRYHDDHSTVDIGVDLDSLSVFLSPIIGLIGVVLGVHLNRRSALTAAREEREHASSQEVQRRKEEAAARLDAAVHESQSELPSDVKASEAAEQLAPIRTRLLHALARNAILDDPEIDRRFLALNITLGMATQARNWRRGEHTDSTLNLWPANVAMRELREALTYYQRREDPPPAKYPTSKELIRIVHGDGFKTFEAINDWLVDHEVG